MSGASGCDWVVGHTQEQEEVFSDDEDIGLSGKENKDAYFTTDFNDIQ